MTWRRRIAGLLVLFAVGGVAVLLIADDSDQGSKPKPRAALPRDDLSRGAVITAGSGDARARALVTMPDDGVAVAAATTDGGRLGTTIIRRGPHGERLADIALPQLGEPYGLAVGPDGRLIVMTRKDGHFGVARIAGRGLDRAFGDGQQSMLADGPVAALAIAADGTIAVTDGGAGVIAVTRVSADGKAPSSTEVRPATANIDPGSQAAQPATPVGAVFTSDRGLLIGAASRVGDGATAVPEIVRIASSGGPGGVTDSPVRGRWTAFAALADGSTIVAGSVRDHGHSVLAAVRFTADRQLDRTFGDGGLATVRLPADAYAGAVVADPRGGLLFGANTSAAGHPQTTILRLADDGKVDPSFARIARPGRLGGMSFDRADRLLVTTSAFSDGRLRVGLYRLRV